MQRLLRAYLLLALHLFPRLISGSALSWSGLGLRPGSQLITDAAQVGELQMAPKNPPRSTRTNKTNNEVVPTSEGTTISQVPTFHGKLREGALPTGITATTDKAGDKAVETVLSPGGGVGTAIPSSASIVHGKKVLRPPIPLVPLPLPLSAPAKDSSIKIGTNDTNKVTNATNDINAKPLKGGKSVVELEGNLINMVVYTEATEGSLEGGSTEEIEGETVATTVMYSYRF